MRIGKIASTAGVPAKTIRFWEAEGLLPEPHRSSSGYRDYEPEVIDRLDFIRHAQAGGLTLTQIRQVLSISDSGDAPCQHVGRYVAQRLEEVEARLSELAATRRQLQQLARRAAAQDPTDCRGYCTIISG
ncbi:MAG: heavy metal-responsive transcriptional regulator [Dehalococcoidia bacterium]